MNEYFKQFLQHDFMDSIFSGYVWKINAMAMGMAFIFLLINFGKMAFTGAVRGQELVKIPEFVRCLVIMISIPIVPAGMKLICNFSLDVAEIAAPTESDRQQLVNYLDHKSNQFYQSYESKTDLEKLNQNSFNHDNVIGTDGKVVDSKTNQSDVNLNKTVAEADDTTIKKSSWTDYFDWLGSPIEVIMWLLDYLISLAFLIVKFCYTGYYIYFIKFLCLIGPFPLAFSILPFSREKSSEWFGVVWNSMFVFTTFNILDALMAMNVTVTEHMFFGSDTRTGEAFTMDSSVPRICFSLVMVFLYVKVPYITSLYAGSSAGNTVFKDGLSTVSTFAMGVAAGTSGGSSGGQSSGGMMAQNQNQDRGGGNERPTQAGSSISLNKESSQ